MTKQTRKTVDLLFRTFTVENWLIFGKTFEFYMRTSRFKCFAFTECVNFWWKCAPHVFGLWECTQGKNGMVQYSTLEYSVLARVWFKCSISSWRRWIKWDMRATSNRTKQTKQQQQQKTQKAPHRIAIFWNCIKKQCNSLPIAIDIYLCFISLWNIEIV